MPTYDYRCVWSHCGAEKIEFRKYEEREDSAVCDVCGGKAHYKISAQITNASYPDGLKRSDASWAKLKTVARLQRDVVREADLSKRGEIKAELEKAKQGK